MLRADQSGFMLVKSASELGPSHLNACRGQQKSLLTGIGLDPGPRHSRTPIWLEPVRVVLLPVGVEAGEKAES